MSLRRVPATALRVCLSGALLCSSQPAHAGTMTGGSTEWTQILNNISLLQQVIHMIRSVIQLKKQCELAAQNLKHLGSLDEVDQMLSGISGVVSSTRGIVFAGESIAANYKNRISGPNTLSTQWAESHPGRVDPRSLPSARGNPNGPQVDAAAFRRIDDSVQNAVRKSLATLDVQASEFDSDEQIFTKLKARIDDLNNDDSKAGQMQALIVGNALLAEILRQLMKLRQVLIAQANAQGEFESADAQRRQFEDAISDRQYRYSGAYRGDGEVDHSEASFGRSTGMLSSAGGWVTGSADGAAAPGATPTAGLTATPGGAALSGATSYVDKNGRVVGLAPGATAPGDDDSYVVGGRKVALAPGATVTGGGSYVGDTGRVVGLAPGATAPGDDNSYIVDGRKVGIAPGATVTGGGSYVGDTGRVVGLAPGATAPGDDNSYIVDGRKVGIAPPAAESDSAESDWEGDGEMP